MRPEVRLGIAISMVVVLVAGGYYFFRDPGGAPIPVSSRIAGAAGRETPGSAAKTSPPKSADKKSAAGNSAKRRVARSNKTNSGPRNAATGAQRSDSARGKRRSAATGDNLPARKRNRRPASNGAGGGRPLESGPASTVARGGQPAGAGSSKSAERQAGRQGERAADQPGAADRTTPGSQRVARNSEMDATNGGGRRPRGGAAETKSITPTRGRSATTGHGRNKPHAPDQAQRNRAAQLAATAPPKAAVETHRLQAGESFASLARSYYGHEKHTQFLIDANPQIGDPNRLRIGTVVRIPAAPSGHKATSLEKRTRPRGNQAKKATYVVKPGDSFYAIARSVLNDASRWKELLALNRDLVRGDPKRLQVGQELVLPE